MFIDLAEFDPAVPGSGIHGEYAREWRSIQEGFISQHGFEAIRDSADIPDSVCRTEAIAPLAGQLAIASARS